MLLLAAGVLLFLLTPSWVRCQVPGAIPPDVQAIMNKISSGKVPTAAEQKRLQEWAASQSAALQQGASGASGGQQPGTPKTPQPGQGAQVSLKGYCPAATGAPLPATAPTAAEYTALVNSLVSRYRAKLAQDARTSIDALFAQPAGGTELGASYGAFLNAAGAINEAVFAAALAAQKNPADLLAANNLGVNLSEAGDQQSSARILLYVTKMRPNSPLAAINLGWTYFDAGAKAPAQKEFQLALGLAPDMSGPEAGMGLLAGCRGDNATATSLLKSSLSKGYSGVAAAAFLQAQASQPPPSETSQDQQDQSAQAVAGSDESPAAPANESQMIPDLPIQPEGERNVGEIAALKRVSDWVAQNSNDLMSHYSDAAARVAALNRRAQQNGDAIDLPIVFDRELFEFGQTVDLTFTARFRNWEPTNQSITEVMNNNAQETAAIVIPEQQRFLEEGNELDALIEQQMACGASDACSAEVEKRIDAKKGEMDETAYEICVHGKQSIDVTYGQSYKHWKTGWDDLRPAAADLYAFTDPILQRVWVPSVNEMLQLRREMTVMALYRPLSAEAAALAANGAAYKDLVCVPPPPPPPVENADTPNLPKSNRPRCPFDPPKSVGFGALSMTLACDDVSISGGEVLRFKVQQNFRTHETTLWGGVGASAGAEADFLGPMSPKAELTAEAGVGVKFGQGGDVTDVFVSSSMSAGASFAGKSLDISVSGSAGLESGPTLKAQLPGGISGTLRGN
jgi:Flp pilus assembly protein TadD